jgi:NTP pyrophosphatase (non-canonical NTP hydrolase)
MQFQLNPTAVAAAARALQDQCFGAANAAGWWKTVKTGEPVIANPYAFSNKLMLTVSELSEAMEGDRKGLMDDKLPHRPMREVELADAVIRIFDMAGGFDLDLAGAIAEKLAFNAQRPDHKIAHRQADGGKTY